ncbi:helix-turn-helix domain-containing protein [Enterococcus sp. LJL98]
MKREHLESKSLFGLDRDFLLKNQLLQLLDNASGYLTSNELASLISGISNDTILQTCRTIREDLKALHSADDCELIIHPNLGVRFIRNTLPLKTIIDFYATQELAYTLIQKLFHYREIISYEFYEEQHISESTLRRKIKTINHSLNKYHIHITFAQKIKLVGSEIAIRSFYFYFLFLIYRQLPVVPGIENQGFFELRTKKIQAHLELGLTIDEQNVFSLIYYTHEHGVHSGSPLKPTEEDRKLFNQFDFPAKPTFLNNWSLDDWYFFLLFSMATNLFQADFGIDSRNMIKPLFNFEVKTWIQIFQMPFQQLTSLEKEMAYQNISRALILSHFISLDDDFFKLFRIIQFEDFQQHNPYFYHKFTQFWEDFRSKIPTLDTSAFKFTSLMLAVHFVPLDTRLYSLEIATYSEISSLFAKYLFDRVNIHFKSKYDLRFIDDFAQADLIVSTCPLAQENDDHSLTVIIDPLLNQNDLLRIEAKIQQLIQEQENTL